MVRLRESAPDCRRPSLRPVGRPAYTCPRARPGVASGRRVSGPRPVVRWHTAVGRPRRNRHAVQRWRRNHPHEHKACRRRQRRTTAIQACSFLSLLERHVHGSRHEDNAMCVCKPTVGHWRAKAAPQKLGIIRRSGDQRALDRLAQVPATERFRQRHFHAQHPGRIQIELGADGSAATRRGDDRDRQTGL